MRHSPCPSNGAGVGILNGKKANAQYTQNFGPYPGRATGIFSRLPPGAFANSNAIGVRPKLLRTMSQPPAFQFYPDDFIGGTVGMSTQEAGAYIRLLCCQWGQGQIPSDAKQINRVAGCKVTPAVLQKFPNGKNKRLEAEREKQAIWREKSRQGGLKSAAKRGSTTLQPPLEPPCQGEGQPNGNIPSPSPSPIREREENFPESPPMTRVDFNTLCQMRAVPADCAEWFWNVHDGRNWTDSKGQPIRKVEPLLMNAKATWQVNAARLKTNGNPQNSQKPNPRNFGMGMDSTKSGAAAAALVKRREEERKQKYANSPEPV